MENITPEVESWLQQFEVYVRNQQYQEALPLYESDAIAFGTRVNYLANMIEYASYQWHNIWEKSRNFTFTKVLSSGHDGELFFCSTLWSNQTTINDVEVTRTGRATFVFKKGIKGLVCIHSHFSESPTSA